jgi:hypothetical protein
MSLLNVGTVIAVLGRWLGSVGRRLRRPLLIVVGGVVLLMLLIVVLQSGLGVDSDVTITDSHRPEIVGD